MFDASGIILIIFIVYLILHIPAIILLILGIRRLKSKPENARWLLIVAGVYFLVGGGICGTLLS